MEADIHLHGLQKLDDLASGPTHHSPIKGTNQEKTMNYKAVLGFHRHEPRATTSSMEQTYSAGE